jgi:hypothetical protein
MVLEAGMSVVRRGTSMPLYSGGQGSGRQVQVPADGLGDFADVYAFFADCVDHKGPGRTARFGTDILHQCSTIIWYVKIGRFEHGHHCQ